jgi:hypothetical protein
LGSLYFVHVPKTAGRYLVVGALKHELMEGPHLPKGGLYRGNPSGRFHYGGHNVCHSNPDSPVAYFVHNCAEDEEFRASTTFAFARNPFDLLVSMFTAHWPYGGRIHPHRFGDFGAWLNAYLDPGFDWVVPLQKRCLYFQLFDDGGSFALDRLLRVERLDDELAELCAPLGIEPVRGKAFRPSRFKEDRDHRRYYTDAQRERVEQRFDAELGALGYDFDGPNGPMEPGRLRFDVLGEGPATLGGTSG